MKGQGAPYSTMIFNINYYIKHLKINNLVILLVIKRLKELQLDTKL